MHVRALSLVLAAGLLASATPSVVAETKDEKAERLKEAYDKIVEKSEALEGIVTLRKKEDQIYVDLAATDLKRPFLLFPSIGRGIGAGRFLGGMMMQNDDWVLEFRRVGEKVQIVRKNIRFRAEEDSPMAASVALSYSDSVLASLKVAGEDAVEERLLVRIDPFLKSDLIGLGANLSSSLNGGYRLVSSRTSVSKLEVFEKNFEVEVEQTFAGGELFGPDSVADGRALTLTVHYSFLEFAKDEDFIPRAADDRVGHFLTAFQDHSSEDHERPWVRYVNRWKLEKADPDAKASPVKQPVVFYVSKTVPYEFRPYVRQGVLAWRKAFDAIGYLEAIEVRQQGSSDDWDAGDVRYNVIQWTAEAPFSGIGPSRAHPTTGQLLDADILYSGEGIARMRRRYAVFAPAKVGEDSPEGEPLVPPVPHPDACTFQEGFQHEVALAALQVVASAEASNVVTGFAEVPLEFLGAAVRKTIIHEVGHVLGLRHNFRSSASVPRDKLHDVEYTRENGVTASIMDYPPANLAAPGKPQGEYFSSSIGPYDKWAIRYAYGDLELDEEAEEDAEVPEDVAAALARVADLAAEPQHAYGSDEDRWTGRSRNLDPLTNVYDIGDDPMAYVAGRFEVVRSLWDKVLTRTIQKGEGYQRARYAVRVLLGQLITGSRVVLPYVGGAHHHRDHKGQPGERPPFVPVPAGRQREAVALLCDTVFQDNQYQLSPELLNNLAPPHASHWGAEAIGQRLDFPIHNYIMKVQNPILDRLLSRPILQRLTDGLRQVPADQEVFTAAELMQTLADRIFLEFRAPPIRAQFSNRKPLLSAMRRNLQRNFVTRLAALSLETPGASASDAPILARHVLGELETRIERIGSSQAKFDSLSRGHIDDLLARIRAARNPERYRRGL